jgi:hypothetical protein
MVMATSKIEILVREGKIEYNKKKTKKRGGKHGKDDSSPSERGNQPKKLKQRGTHHSSSFHQPTQHPIT